MIITINSFNYFKARNDHIRLQDLKIGFYIEMADEASRGKGQVNWKYLAAIDGVRYKNKFSKVDKNSLTELADYFIQKENENGQRIYADLLIELIRQYNLQLLDNRVQTE